MSKDETQLVQINIGKLPQKVKDDMDNAVDIFSIMLREYGCEMIPKKWLLAFTFAKWANFFKTLDWSQAKKEATLDMVNQIQKFKAKYLSKPKAEAEKSV